MQLHLVSPQKYFDVLYLECNIYLADESEEKLSVGLLVLLFTAKKQNYEDIMKTLYEKCLVSKI